MGDPKQQPSANGTPVWMGLAMRSGKWGAVAMALASLGELVQFIWPDNTRYDSLTHFLVWSGAAVMLWGLQAHAKRATDIAVTVAAEAKIDRADIAAAVNPASQAAVPTSSDPAVQSEIEKKVIRGTG